jgi:hypothetical protein
VEGRTILLTWQTDDVAIVGWIFVSELEIDTCLLWPIMSGHVAQSFGATCHYFWFIWLCVKVFGESAGFDPGTSPIAKVLTHMC